MGINFSKGLLLYLLSWLFLSCFLPSITSILKAGDPLDIIKNAIASLPLI